MRGLLFFLFVFEILIKSFQINNSSHSLQKVGYLFELMPLSAVSFYAIDHTEES
jgi:hypothetical protein